MQPVSGEEPESYELAPDPPRAARATPPQVRAAVAATKTAAPLNYRAARDEPSAYEPIRNLYLPLWLIAGASAVRLVSEIFYHALSSDTVAALNLWLTGSTSSESWLHFLGGTLLGLVVQLVLGTALLTPGFLLASAYLKIKIKPLWMTLLKLAALWVAPGAVVSFFTVLMFIPLGALLLIALYIISAYVCLGVLFDLESPDTAYCLIITAFFCGLLGWALTAVL